ncbi:MFS transporter [Paenibacillus sp.]|uniref:MFS transporter n=1 Tax=Paenibacillus sp. TaxID=58172 RepID=UPI0028B226B3|nr:MFS transporter [Paenibacillus sp.]
MPKTKKKIYYGWFVVLAAFLCTFASTGLMIYSFSLFLVPMSESLDVPRTSIALASSIFTICMGVVSAYVGNQVTKGRVKKLILIGVILLGGGNALLSITNSLPVYYMCYALVGIGSAFTGPAVTSTLATAWFDKRRGLATGIISCGASVCAIFAPSFLATIMDSSGVRTAYLANSAIVIVLLLIALLLVKTKPQDIGLLPDGLTQEEFDATPSKKRPVLIGLTRNQAMKTPTMILVCIAFAALGFGQIGVMQNAAAYLSDLTFDTKTVASALGFIGLSGGVSTILFGWLSDRINPKLVFCFGNMLLLVATLILTYTQPDSGYGWLVSYGILFGLGMGIWASAVPLVIIKLVGPMNFGAIWGLAFAIRSICGDTLGVPTISKIAETAGYRVAFWVAVIVFAVSAVLIIVAKKPKAFLEMQEATGQVNKA